jgi:hypothetical protein
MVEAVNRDMRGLHQVECTTVVVGNTVEGRSEVEDIEIAIGLIEAVVTIP